MESVAFWLVNRFERGTVLGESAVSEAPRCKGLGVVLAPFGASEQCNSLVICTTFSFFSASVPMVNVATFRMGSARVYYHTARAFELAIKTVDQRFAAISASCAQQHTIEPIVDVSVPSEVAKIIREFRAIVQNSGSESCTCSSKWNP